MKFVQEKIWEESMPDVKVSCLIQHKRVHCTNFMSVCQGHKAESDHASVKYIE